MIIEQMLDIATYIAGFGEVQTNCTCMLEDVHKATNWHSAMNLAIKGAENTLIQL